MKGRFTDDTKSLLTLFYKNTENFKEVLNSNKIADYVTPDQIKATAGKNIIVISIESLERSFLSQKHASLTPNLNRLKKEWSYYDIEQNVGSGWTSGSLYTYLTGFPAFFGKYSYAIFENAYDSQISSISHVLKKANYKTIYMNGNTNHSGVIDMLDTFNFSKVIDVKSIKKTGNESEYGIRDKDLFELAKDQIEKQENSNSPYALFISTTDTHFPDGFYDKRMESVISKKNSNFEFMVAAVDYMIEDFITHLQKNNLLQNTTIYIFPDHLKMGDPSLFKNTGNRGLYLITNADNNLNPIPSEKQYQIDLPNMILNGAEIKHNLKFLTDYISGDKDKYLRENINNITAINTTGFSRRNSRKFIIPKISKHYNKYKKDTLRYIAHAGGTIDEYTYTNSLEALNLSYSKGFRIFELDILKTKDGKYVAAHDWKKWKSMTNYKGKTPVNSGDFIDYAIHEKYTPLDMKRINEWFIKHPDAILVTDKINEPKLFAKEFIDPNRLIMELFTPQAVKEGINTGILSSMPSQNVLHNMDYEEIIKLGIKHIAVSRFFIAANKELLKKLKEKNIKVYLYHINMDGGVVDSGMDENYVTKYELDYAYGMYADKWSFE